ncbi:MAG: hypothetical protein V4548_11445 [Bacteroidota bacterium]
MKKILLLILPILISSCQLFDTPTPSKEELLAKELKAVNWKEVDEFPSVADCENSKDKNLRKQCFFEFLTQAIQEKLSSDTIAILNPEQDTIQVKVTIFPNGNLKFESQFPLDSLTQKSVKLDSILSTKLMDFPKINPAIKRGIPVKTQFILPVILKTTD